ncbi:MAG TPA: DUF559 domain-containing protein [Micropepsaceae bacterium]|nr:DUF559 domain-containing protein [Micropepsaceae bacterium]
MRGPVVVTAQLFHKRNTLARNHARTMRHQPTEWEKRFWSRVRDRRLGGYKFKRQMLIGPFIVDFVCIERKMVVELDGGQHTDNKDYDDNRDAFLKSKGFRVIRVWNIDIPEHIDDVLEMVFAALETAPSP